MHSKLLKEHGLRNRVFGTGYNFRYATVGDAIVTDVNQALKKMNLSPDELYSGQQKHTAHIEYVDGSNGEDFLFGRTFQETDGLITDKRNVALLIKFADCTPVVLFDPVKKVQASVHSGWRGTRQKISLRAIEKMEADFGSRREDILVYLGPSIDQANYEVGPKVYAAFEGFKERDKFFEAKGEKYVLSMLDANLSLIKEAGILSENIEVERASTYKDARLHSARQEGSDYQLNSIITLIK